MNIALALLIAGGIASYWFFCRHASLKHREKAASLIDAFMNDESASSREKDNIYWSYMSARHWFFMPCMALLTPIAMIAMIATDSARAESMKNSPQYDEIMDSIIKMYITRNPLIGAASLVATFISIAVAVPIGMVLNRIRTIPSVSTVYGSVAAKASHSDIRHAH